MGRIWMPGVGGNVYASNDVTATKEKVLTGYTAVTNDSDDEPIAGTMANQGAVSRTLNAGGSYIIPSGYHNGAGKVTASSLASQTGGATANDSDVLGSKTYWRDGEKRTGTMPNLTAQTNIQHESNNSTKVITADGAFLGNNTDGVRRLSFRYNSTPGYITQNTLVGLPAQIKTVTPSTSSQNISADNGKALERVTINPIPSQRSDHPTSARLLVEDGLVKMVPPAGWYNGSSWYTWDQQTLVAERGGLTAAKLMKNQTALNITGTATSDANASAGNILSGKTAYVNGNKITGTIASLAGQVVTPRSGSQTISTSGKYMTGNVTVNGFGSDAFKRINISWPATYIEGQNWTNIAVLPAYQYENCGTMILAGIYRIIASDGNVSAIGGIQTTLTNNQVVTSECYTWKFDFKVESRILWAKNTGTSTSRRRCSGDMSFQVMLSTVL